MAPGGKSDSSSQEEIRFVKDQQWKPVYYPLALFSAIVFIFSQNIIGADNRYYCLLKVLAVVLVALVGSVSIFFQWLHYKALWEYRKDPKITNTKEKIFISILITATFNVVTLSGAAFALIFLLS